MTSPEVRRRYLARQISHWRLAAARLSRVEDLAPPSAWQALEHYLGVTIRRCLVEAVQRLQRDGDRLAASLEAASAPADLVGVRRRLLSFRSQYLRVETTLDFYADAINTRSNPHVGALLRACDTIAYRSMAVVLEPLGIAPPLVLTYLGEGRGAAILKANLRLWDPSTISPAAAIKVVRHNLYRSTALIHETGHQVAHMTNWTPELAQAIRSLLGRHATLAATWATWTSEINADVYAFVHTGYASVSGLHDVVAGGDASVFRYAPGDPHPISYLRVLFGVEMCRQSFGAGPWDELRELWTESHPVERAPAGVREFIRASLPFLPALVELCLTAPMGCFKGKSITAMVDPQRVSPDALRAMEARLGPALYTSMHWIWTEALRLLALTGYNAATSEQHALNVAAEQENWLLRLGSSVRAA